MAWLEREKRSSLSRSKLDLLLSQLVLKMTSIKKHSHTNAICKWFHKGINERGGGWSAWWGQWGSDGANEGRIAAQPITLHASCLLCSCPAAPVRAPSSPSLALWLTDNSKGSATCVCVCVSVCYYPDADSVSVLVSFGCTGFGKLWMGACSSKQQEHRRSGKKLAIFVIKHNCSKGRCCNSFLISCFTST